jgi:hypothetical protein
MAFFISHFLPLSQSDKKTSKSPFVVLPCSELSLDVRSDRRTVELITKRLPFARGIFTWTGSRYLLFPDVSGLFYNPSINVSDHNL